MLEVRTLLFSTYQDASRCQHQHEASGQSLCFMEKVSSKMKPTHTEQSPEDNSEAVYPAVPEAGTPLDFQLLEPKTPFGVLRHSELGVLPRESWLIKEQTHHIPAHYVLRWGLHLFDAAGRLLLWLLRFVLFLGVEKWPGEVQEWGKKENDNSTNNSSDPRCTLQLLMPVPNPAHNGGF